MIDVLAVSGQQALGVGIGIALLVGWAIYVLVNVARPERPAGSEVTDAPNRKQYFDDDALEGPKLDKALTWGLLTLAFVAVALPVYWLREPGRQDGALNGFDKKSVNRGAVLFQSTGAELEPGQISAGCADCHGSEGQGGSTQFILQEENPDTDETEVHPVTWAAPALDDVMYRFSPDEVRNILVYGRPPTPMPAWGVRGGGALGDQQIDDLVNFLVSIQKSPDEVAEDGEAQGLDGKALFESNCARCHTQGWSYKESYQEPSAVDGGGAFGPSLVGGATLRQFPDDESHFDFIVAGSDFQKNYGKRGIGSGRMPGFGPDATNTGTNTGAGCRNTVCTTSRFGRILSDAQIRAIVAYERSL